MTTQEYRRANYRFVSNPVYDKGVWKNIKNELFTYHPSLLATTLHSNKRPDIERRRSFNVSWSVCFILVWFGGHRQWDPVIVVVENRVIMGKYCLVGKWGEEEKCACLFKMNLARETSLRGAIG